MSKPFKCCYECMWGEETDLEECPECGEELTNDTVAYFMSLKG